MNWFKSQIFYAVITNPCQSTLVLILLFFLSDPFTKQIMKEYHNTDPTFDEYKYAYGEPDQSKVKTILIMKCRKGLFRPSIFARKRYLRRLFKNILYL